MPILLACLKAMRPKQWAKNVFLFAAIVFSLQFLNWELWFRILQAFAALRPSEVRPDIEQEVTIVASDYAVRTCMNEATRLLREVFPNLRLDVLPLSKRSPNLLANGEVDLVLAGQSLTSVCPARFPV